MPYILSQTETSTTYLHEQGDQYVIQTVTDVEAAFERAKALHNEGYTRTAGGQWHVASVPVAVMDLWAKMQGKTYMDLMQDDDLMTRFLRDPANSGWLIDKSAV